MSNKVYESNTFHKGRLLVTEFNGKSVPATAAERVVGVTDTRFGAKSPAHGYRTPGLFPIGQAEDLMRAASTTGSRDSQNWWRY
jgi:hypothetical protein